MVVQILEIKTLMSKCLAAGVACIFVEPISVSCVPFSDTLWAYQMPPIVHVILEGTGRPSAFGQCFLTGHAEVGVCLFGVLRILVAMSARSASFTG